MLKKLAVMMLVLCHSCIIYAKDSTSPQKLSILLNWMPSATHAPLVIAKQQGFFKEQGLDVTLIAPNGPIPLVKLIAENKADIGLINEPRFLEKLDEGVPIVRVGTLIDKPLNCVIVLEKSGIKSLADLKGKEIGETSDSKIKNAVLIAMLKKEGINGDEFNVVPLKDHYLSALLSHKVDAISGALRNVEVAALEKSGEKVVVFYPEEHGTPAYSEIIFISHKDHAHDSRFPKFLAAIKKAVRYIDEHPEAAWKDFTDEYPDLDNAVNHAAWFKTFPFFSENPEEINHDDWNDLLRFMQKHHLIRHNDLSELNSYIG